MVGMCVAVEMGGQGNHAKRRPVKSCTIRQRPPPLNTDGLLLATSAPPAPPSTPGVTLPPAPLPPAVDSVGTVAAPVPSPPADVLPPAPPEAWQALQKVRRLPAGWC